MTPWSVRAIGLISLGCALASLLLRWLIEHFDLGSWGVVALVPLWFVAVLASVNAFSRQTNNETFDSWLGSTIMLMVFYSMVWPVWVQ